jgi:hypothetical protein
MSEDIASKNPKTTLTAVAMGIECLSSLVKDATLRQVCIIISPAVAFAGIFLFNNIKQNIEFRRGIKVYRLIISDFEKDLLNPNLTADEKKEMQKEIFKVKADINKARIENIKIITH